MKPTCRDRASSFTFLCSFLSSKNRVTGMHQTVLFILRITRNGIPFDISDKYKKYMFVSFLCQLTINVAR